MSFPVFQLKAKSFNLVYEKVIFTMNWIGGLYWLKPLKANNFIVCATINQRDVDKANCLLFISFYFFKKELHCCGDIIETAGKLGAAFFTCI